MCELEREFSEKITRYEKALEKYGILENEMWQISEEEKLTSSTNKIPDFRAIVGYYFLNLNYEKFSLLGAIEITMYGDNSFGIGNERVPFYINDFYSIQELITIFYGTSFNLKLDRIRSVDFVRYAITLPEIRAKDFSKLLVYVRLLNECLHKVHEKVVYD